MSVAAQEPGRRPPRMAAILAVLAAAAASAAASWQCWINPFVDSGREMDVPARLAAGERLYRDVDFYYGPVGPWVAAAAVRLGGRHWLVLETLDAALAAAIFVLLYRLTARAGSARTAAVVVAFAAAFCFGAPNGGAFLFPYSADNLFALAGGLLALDSVAASPHWRRRAAGALGLAVALAARLELGLAMAAILAVCELLLPPRGGLAEGLRESVWRLAGGAAGALVAYAVAFSGVALAALVAAGPLTHFFALPPEWRRMYEVVAGLARPAEAVARFGLAALLDAALLAAAALAASPRLRWPAAERWRQLIWCLVVAAGALYLAAASGERPPTWRTTLPPLLFPVPLLAAGAAAWTLAGGLLQHPRRASAQGAPPAVAGAAGALPPRAGDEWAASARDTLRARFLLFAATAAVSLRVVLGLNVGPTMNAYSALPLPLLAATACVLAFDGLGARLPDPPVFRRRLAAVLAAAAALYLYQLGRIDWGEHMTRVETPAGALRLRFGEAVAVGETLDYLASHARPGDTLATFPEAGFFNFVTGLRNPLREEQVFPGVLDAERGLAAARRLALARPRFILLCNRPTREYGAVRFGADYAFALGRRIERLYVPTEAFGLARPLARVGARRFFIRLYEPREIAGGRTLDPDDAAVEPLSAPVSASGNPSAGRRASPAGPGARRL
jgi:hypothetical protein